MVTRKQLEQWAERHGFRKDRWNHYQKSQGDREYRLKLSSIAVRYEVKLHHEGGRYSGPSTEWMRLRSGYFKNVSIGLEDKLSGLR